MVWCFFAVKCVVFVDLNFEFKTFLFSQCFISWSDYVENYNSVDLAEPFESNMLF